MLRFVFPWISKTNVTKVRTHINRGGKNEELSFDNISPIKKEKNPDPVNYTQGSQTALFEVTFDLNRFRTHQNTNKPRVTNRWSNKIAQGRSEVGGTAVSHSLTWAQCTLCVCAFTAGPSVMESEGVWCWKTGGLRTQPTTRWMQNRMCLCVFVLVRPNGGLVQPHPNLGKDAEARTPWNRFVPQEHTSLLPLWGCNLPENNLTKHYIIGGFSII